MFKGRFKIVLMIMLFDYQTSEYTPNVIFLLEATCQKECDTAVYVVFIKNTANYGNLKSLGVHYITWLRHFDA